MNFKETLEKLENWAKTFPEARTDEMVQLVRLGIDKGWYLNEAFLFGINRDFQEGEDLNCFLQEQILSEWNEYWGMIFRLSPDRESLLTEAKMAFENQIYGAAIHMYFSQADGLFYDKFGKNLFTSRGQEAKAKFGGHLTDFIARDSWESLIGQFKDGSVFRRMYNEVYKEGFSVTSTDLMKKTDNIPNEQDLVIPNRHGVLHGIHKNYGTKLNALKCFSLLLFVMYAIYGDDAYDGI
jgi:hypothetical protein